MDVKELMERSEALKSLVRTIRKQEEVRYWVEYDGGTTQERQIARIARRHGGREVATTDDMVVCDIPADRTDDFEADIADAGFEIAESE